MIVTYIIHYVGEINCTLEIYQVVEIGENGRHFSMWSIFDNIGPTLSKWDNMGRSWSNSVKIDPTMSNTSKCVKMDQRTSTWIKISQNWSNGLK